MAVPTTGQFDIVIQMPEETGKAPAATSTQPMQEAEPALENPVQGKKENAATTAALTHMLMSSGRQALNAVASNIGLAMGNQRKQERVQKSIQGITTTVTVAGMLLTGNWIGALAVGVSAGISSASEAYQQNKQREIDNYVAAQYARKLGYTNARR